MKELYSGTWTEPASDGVRYAWDVGYVLFPYTEKEESITVDSGMETTEDEAKAKVTEAYAKMALEHS